MSISQNRNCDDGRGCQRLTVELLGKSEQLQNWPDSQLLALIVDNPQAKTASLPLHPNPRDFVKVCMTAKIQGDSI